MADFNLGTISFTIRAISQVREGAQQAKAEFEQVKREIESRPINITTAGGAGRLGGGSAPMLPGSSGYGTAGRMAPFMLPAPSSLETVFVGQRPEFASDRFTGPRRLSQFELRQQSQSIHAAQFEAMRELERIAAESAGAAARQARAFAANIRGGLESAGFNFAGAGASPRTFRMGQGGGFRQLPFTVTGGGHTTTALARRPVFDGEIIEAEWEPVASGNGGGGNAIVRSGGVPGGSPRRPVGTSAGSGAVPGGRGLIMPPGARSRSRFFGRPNGMGLFFQAMFGGWELSSAMMANGAAQFAVDNNFALDQQLSSSFAAVEQTRGGILGSIANLFLDPMGRHFAGSQAIAGGAAIADARMAGMAGMRNAVAEQALGNSLIGRTGFGLALGQAGVGLERRKKEIDLQVRAQGELDAAAVKARESELASTFNDRVETERFRRYREFDQGQLHADLRAGRVTPEQFEQRRADSGPIEQMFRGRDSNSISGFRKELADKLGEMRTSLTAGATKEAELITAEVNRQVGLLAGQNQVASIRTPVARLAAQQKFERAQLEKDLAGVDPSVSGPALASLDALHGSQRLDQQQQFADLFRGNQRGANSAIRAMAQQRGVIAAQIGGNPFAVQRAQIASDRDALDDQIGNMPAPFGSLFGGGIRAAGDITFRARERLVAAEEGKFNDRVALNFAGRRAQMAAAEQSRNFPDAANIQAIKFSALSEAQGFMQQGMAGHAQEALKLGREQLESYRQQRMNDFVGRQVNVRAFDTSGGSGVFDMNAFMGTTPSAAAGPVGVVAGQQQRARASAAHKQDVTRRRAQARVMMQRGDLSVEEFAKIGAPVLAGSASSQGIAQASGDLTMDYLKGQGAKGSGGTANKNPADTLDELKEVAKSILDKIASLTD